MATLSEAATWVAGIYQLETTDPVLGGPDGIDNLQAKQLANRTLWLKGQVESLGTGKQPLDATLTALAGLPTEADRLIYSVGLDSFSMTPLTAFIRTLLDDVDAAAARTTLGAAPVASPAFSGTPTAPTAAPGTNTQQLASTAFVQTAIAALVASSPATLDTLNELAEALGNDPNFATTMTTALSLKAPLASPAFVGTPTAPTPAQFDNDTSLATTEFVQRALGALAGSIAYTANTTLTAADCGKLVGVAGNVTITLPLSAAIPAGTLMHIRVGNGSTVSIVPQGADKLADLASSLLASLQVVGASYVVLRSYGSGNGWEVLSGDQALRSSSLFAISLATNGYQKLPTGLIIQWGSFISSPTAGASVAVTFPAAFPTSVLSIAGAPGGGGTATSGFWTDTMTNSGFNGRSNQASSTIRWIAVGY